MATWADPQKECSCTSAQILAYQKKLSGPLLDRIDLIVNVSRVANSDLLETKHQSAAQHAAAFTSIETATDMQLQRYKSSTRYNSSLSSSEINQYIQLDAACKQLLAAATDKLNLSARSYFKIIKVARTIADLASSPNISPVHISEALQYRQQTS